MLSLTYRRILDIMIENKSLCLVRVPPGDNWKEPHDVDDSQFSSLTAGLEHIFQRTGIKEYRISAEEGAVYAITFEEEAPILPTKYSLYGDE